MNKLTDVLNDTKEANNNDLIVPELYSLEEEETKKENNVSTISNKRFANKSKNSQTSNFRNPKKLPLKENLVRTSAPVSKSASKQNYVPKRISSINYDNSNYTTYLGKVEDLYVMINDAVYANETIKECKENIFSYCQILNEIAKKIKSGELEVSKDQIASCNKLLKELGRNINKITDTRNEVSKNCKTFAENRSLNNGIDTISSNYVGLINCLDTRITDYENILTLLGQIQCVLTDTCYNQDLNQSDNTQAVEDLVQDYYENNCFTNEHGTYCPRTTETPSTYPFFKNETNNENDEEALKNTPKTLEEPIVEDENKEIKEKKPSKNIDSYSNNTTSNSSTENKTTQNKLNNQTTTNQTTPPVVQSPIQNGIVGNGIANNGIVGNGIVGNGIVGNGYGIGAPIHNFENGVMNPYRNTDTYKLPSNPLGNGIAGYNNGFGTRILSAEDHNFLQKPLPQERRKNFKTFNSSIHSNANLETEKTKINSSTISKYDEVNKSPITKETIKNSLKKFVNQ